MADYANQKKYFEQAYKTGSDMWTHIPFKLRGSSLTTKIPSDAMILDVGAGRGLWAVKLAEMGYRVVGMDYVKWMVDKQNEEVKPRNLGGRLGFIEGDVLDIPFGDGSFDAVTDFGLLQHIDPEDWDIYVSEVSRVIKSGGYLLLVELSKHTTSLFRWNPKAEKEIKYVQDGVVYCFFAEDQIKDMFYENFEVVDQKVEYIPENANVAYVETLLKRK